ncbi:hypothetical protein [Sulfitobacter aestuariivivens]|uniref:hypothetical protein n=1 Tax=Sulfitobacter aestuariivivens TaxID=2766981 RepID=UPI003610C488
MPPEHIAHVFHVRIADIQLAPVNRHRAVKDQAVAQHFETLAFFLLCKHGRGDTQQAGQKDPP